MAAPPKFAALRLTDKATVCRTPRCFVRRYDLNRFVKIDRYLTPEDCRGLRCVSCFAPLAPRPSQT